MLEIKANKTLLLDGNKLDAGDGTMSDLLLSLLGCPVQLDKELTLADLVHILYDIREFINLYCFEEYEVLRAMVNAGTLADPSDFLRIFKNAEETSDGYLKINIQSEIESYSEVGKFQKLANVKVMLDSKIVDGDGILREGVVLKADFTLLEIVEVLFEDLLNSLKRDGVLC